MLANSGYEGFIKEHEKTIQAQNTNNIPKKQTSFEKKKIFWQSLTLKSVLSLNSDLPNESYGLIILVTHLKFFFQLNSGNKNAS